MHTEFTVGFDKTALGFPPNKVFGNVATAMRKAPGGLPKSKVGFTLPKAAMVVKHMPFGGIQAAIKGLGRPTGTLQRSVRPIEGGLQYGFERIQQTGPGLGIRQAQEAKRLKRMELVRQSALAGLSKPAVPAP